MNELYTKRLVKLAQEIINLTETVIITAGEENRAKKLLRYRNIHFQAKLNYLLGYIMALDNKDESENKNIKVKSIINEVREHANCRPLINKK